MAVKVGVNGFGRIGRLLTRMLGEGDEDISLALINSRADSFTLAHLLKYDSVHGKYQAEVDYDEDRLVVNGREVAITRVAQPADLPLADLGVDIMLETTGKFKTKDQCQGHLDAGAKKVIIGAPGKGIDGTFVMGVNDELYEPKSHHIISNASCTTNCLAPVAKVLNDEFGLEHGLMTTTHSYTMSQRILDGSKSDIRRARAAALSMIPTTTGAAKAVSLVIPELAGKLDGFAIRVPVPDVSLVDLTARLGREVDSDQVNDALKKAADGPMKGYLHVTDEPLVSIDYVSSTYSSIVDAPLTQVAGDRMVKVLAWYDNEMGYAARILDLARLVAGAL